MKRVIQTTFQRRIKKIVYQVVRVSNVRAVVQFADGHVDPGSVGHGHVGEQEPEKYFFLQYIENLILILNLIWWLIDWYRSLIDSLIANWSIFD